MSDADGRQVLFSYGTLREHAVQLSLFGRVLHGEPDELVEFEQRMLRIDDPGSSTHGETHAIVRFSGEPADRVSGTALEVSEVELASADAYEPPPYERIRAVLASGRQAWVYAEVESS